MPGSAQYIKLNDLPSLDAWMNVEYPLLSDAFTSAQGHAPDERWAAFQTYRRYMEPDQWPFSRMLAWETNGGHDPIIPASSVPYLQADGPVFRIRDTSEYYRVKSVTAFNLIDLYSKGRDIDAFLSKYNRSNRVRIFLYTNPDSWGSDAWNYPSNEAVVSFIRYLITKGKATSLCLLTDANEARIAQANNLINHLNTFNFPGLLLEAKNEPLTHDKGDSNALKNALNGSLYLYGSGVYEDLKKFWGKVGYIHTPRDSEWPRKAKDAIEAYRGMGPNSLDEPACKVPWILDEPIKPTEVASSPNLELDYYCYAALSSCAGAGVTFHCESAKLGQLPSTLEYGCYNTMMDGANVYPESAPLGDYEHLASCEENGDAALRVYRVGKYITVIRPNGVRIPSNWKSLDSCKVCYELV